MVEEGAGVSGASKKVKCLAVKAPLRKAEEVRKALAEKGLLAEGLTFKKAEDSLLLPVKEGALREESLKGLSFSEEEFEERKREEGLRDALKSVLSQGELDALKTSFDRVGSIVILEIDEELRGKEELIARTVLETVPGVDTVLRKDEKHKGLFRTQRLKFLAGVDTRVALHRENGVELRVDVENTYFSPRLSTERKRIAGLVERDERVLVMYSGCAPYPCVIARNAEPEVVVGVEINPVAHRYAVENVSLNKLQGRIELFQGDVAEVVPKLELFGSFDRVVMPAPEQAFQHLGLALRAVKKGGVIHFYCFAESVREAERFLKGLRCDGCKRCELEGGVLCGQVAPRKFRVCLDLKTR